MFIVTIVPWHGVVVIVVYVRTCQRILKEESNNILLDMNSSKKESKTGVRLNYLHNSEPSQDGSSEYRHQELKRRHLFLNILFSMQESRSYQNRPTLRRAESRNTNKPPIIRIINNIF